MPTDQLPPRRGWSFPAGASLATDPADGCTGVNFSVTSHHATAVTVLLFGQGNGDTLATTPDHRIALHNLGHGHWAAFVPGLQAGQRYALCADGPRDPAHGHRFEPAQTLIDPWACGLLGPTDLLARPDAQPIPHSLVVNHAAERAAGAAIAPRPSIAADRVVIYEAHVKSLTRLHPGVPETQRGTTAQGMDAQTMLDYMGIIMDTEKLQNRSFTINLKLTDGDDYLLKIHHGVLLYYKDALSDEADLTISTPRIGILAITSGNQENIDKLITVEKGDKALFQVFCDSMAAFDLYFNIIEP